MTENHPVPNPTDRERAREIACGYLRCAVMRKEFNLLPDQHRLQCDTLTEYLITALTSVRAETVEQAAMLVAGWSTAVNAKAMIKIEEDHCRGVAERDFAMADAIRALTKTEETDTKAEPTAAPCMIDGCRFESLHSRNAELEGALREYGCHTPECNGTIASDDVLCDCGFAATYFRTPSQSLDRVRKERAVIDAAREIAGMPKKHPKFEYKLHALDVAVQALGTRSSTDNTN